MKMDFCTLQTENKENGFVVKAKKLLMSLSHKIFDKNPYQQQRQYREFHQAIYQLHTIFEVKQAELTEYPDDLPTSFDDVAKKIAKYTSECLVDVPQQKRDTSYILTLLLDYKVLQPTHHQKVSVSLDQFVAILTDNFPNSYLTKILMVFTMGIKNVETKVILFS